MRHRTDSNQRHIIAVLREAGASVFSLAAAGKGCPDLLVGWNGANILLEIKNPGGRGMRFTPAEREFMDTWRGRVLVVSNELQALDALNGGEM
jgi:hypothetical protein